MPEGCFLTYFTDISESLIVREHEGKKSLFEKLFAEGDGVKIFLRAALHNEPFFFLHGTINKVIITYSFFNDNCCDAAIETRLRKLNLETHNYRNY